jgi:hypothetical protein
MAKDEAFIEDFKKLLESIPSNYSLPQWQFAFRQVSYLMGMKILGNFSADVVGPDPSGLQAPGPEPALKPGSHAGEVSYGQSGGGHPNVICGIVCAALGIGSPGGKNPQGSQ